MIQDTGFGIERSSAKVLVGVTSRPRIRERETLYRLLTERLQQRCEIAADDVMVTITENSDEDWSFGSGRAAIVEDVVSYSLVLGAARSL